MALLPRPDNDPYWFHIAKKHKTHRTQGQATPRIVEPVTFGAKTACTRYPVRGQGCGYTLVLAAAALGEPEPIMPMQRGAQPVPSGQRLHAVAVRRRGCPNPMAEISRLMRCPPRHA